MERLALLSPLDWAGLAILLLAWIFIGWIIEHPPRKYPSVTILMKDYRREWMHQMLTRQPRIFDATILSTLRQGTTFFASGCMIAIGGVMALAGDPASVAAVADNLSQDQQPVLIWQLKFLAVALLLAHAFLKFVWSNRLFGYCAVVMAAAPNTADDPIAQVRANQAAAINIRAAINFNRGLRSVYFALSTLAWLLGPLPLIVATLGCAGVLASREFASHAREVILGRVV